MFSFGSTEGKTNVCHVIPKRVLKTVNVGSPSHYVELERKACNY